MTLHVNQAENILVPVYGISNHPVTVTLESHPDCRTTALVSESDVDKNQRYLPYAQCGYGGSVTIESEPQ